MTKASRSPTPSGRPPARVLFLGSLAVVALAASLLAGVWWWSARARAAMPAFVDLSIDVAPEVAAFVREIEDAVRAQPNEGERWARLGMACEANGLLGAARRAYERTTQLAPNDPRWQYRRAIVASRLGELDEALASIDRALAQHDRYAPAHWRRGLWLLDRGDLAAAEASFSRAVEIDPNDPGGRIGLARLFLQRRDPARAAEVLEQLLNKHPGDRYALQLLGTAYRRLGRMEDAQFALAIGSIGEPIWRDPWTDELARYRRGFAAVLKEATARAAAGQFDLAIPLFEQLHRQKPDEVSLMNQLGRGYLAAGRIDEAFVILGRAETRDPDNPETHAQLASAYLRRGDIAAALARADRAVALGPSSPGTHEARAMVLWKARRLEEALDAFRRAERYDPTNASLSVWIGSILTDLQRWSDALPQFERAIRINPALADAFVGLGIVRTSLGQLAEADAALARAEALDPNNPTLAPARRRLNAAIRPGQ